MNFYSLAGVSAKVIDFANDFFENYKEIKRPNRNNAILSRMYQLI